MVAAVKKKAPKVKKKKAPAQSVANEAPAELASVPAEPDVVDVDPGSGEGEIYPPFNAETWVVLDGSHPDVPDELDGKLAGVISVPPTITTQDPDTGEPITVTPPKAKCTVREASQGSILNLPVDAFSKVYNHGRPAESVEPAAAGLA